MDYLEKAFYDVYVNKDTSYHSDIDRKIDYSEFTYIQRFDVMEDAITFALNIVTVENLKDITWEEIGEKVVIIDETKNIIKVIIDIGYEIIDRLVNKDLNSTFKSIRKTIRRKIEEAENKI